MQKLIPGDPRPIDLKSTVAILVGHSWFQRDQVHSGFRHSPQHLRNQLNRKVGAQNVSLNRVAIVFCIATKGALPASIDSFESVPETFNWARTLRFSRLATPQFT